MVSNFAHHVPLIQLEKSKLPHVILSFKGTSIEEIKINRPKIKGVDLTIDRFLGNHKDVQGWDFIPWNNDVALLIPKRYVFLSGRNKILSICLLFEDKV